MLRKKEDKTRQLASLAVHLATRRDAILAAWKSAVDSDPAMTVGSALPIVQFNDHIPQVLQDFERRLRIPLAQDSVAESQEKHALEHGLQRWQQGYDLDQVVREWGHFQLCVADELEAYFAGHRKLPLATMSAARRAWMETCTDGINASTAEFTTLRQAEAQGHVQDLEQALAEVSEVEKRRGELWREAMHDLRGNLGVVKNVSAGLAQSLVQGADRDHLFRLLDKNVSSLHGLLKDLTSLAHLQAGHEARKLAPLDAGALLESVVDNVQPVAATRNLLLTADGPATYRVEGDAVKIQRIAQNLLLNALKYTDYGRVAVTWGDERGNERERWMFSVRDTGPGFDSDIATPMLGELEQATEDSREVERETTTGEKPRKDEAPPAPSRPESVDRARGEGIGLSIVKRLCELLDATLELETAPGRGTVFRVILPRSYAVHKDLPPSAVTGHPDGRPPPAGRP